MSLVMEGTHTVLRMYKPIQEMCFISLYSPARTARGSSRGGSVQPLCRYQRDLTGEDYGRTKQRHQSYKIQSCEATKGAIAQLQWLAAEHTQLLTDVLALCCGCADRLKMGNQDGKLQETPEGHREYVGCDVSNGHLSLSSENKRSASRVRKLKKLGSKRMDSAEEFLQYKMKKKMQRNSEAIPEEPKAPGTPASIHDADTPGTCSYVSVSSEPFLPMEEHFHVTRDGCDLMEEPQAFESEMDICSELVDFDNQLCLEYENASCSSVDEESVCVLQERNQTGDESCKQRFENHLYDELNQRDITYKDNQKVEYTISLESKEIHKETEDFKNERNRPSETTITPSSSSNLRPWTKSPTSCSLSGVFNVSYPPCNSLQSMSPVLSPSSSKLPSPQMNHRIVLLPEEDDGNKRSSRDQPKTTEVIDKNGNRRMVSRLDLNLCRQDISVDGASSSSAMVSENSLLRPEDIWMLDGDDSISQEPLSRPNRPDHLDFLRITPPEDDIIGDTPYYPKLGVTVQKPQKPNCSAHFSPVSLGSNLRSCHGKQSVSKGFGRKQAVSRHLLKRAREREPGFSLRNLLFS